MQGNAAHFYEKKSKGFAEEGGWDLQKIEVGIALCHFSFGLEEQGLSFHLALADPGLPVPEETAYVASFVMD